MRRTLLLATVATAIALAAAIGCACMSSRHASMNAGAASEPTRGRHNFGRVQTEAQRRPQTPTSQPNTGYDDTYVAMRPTPGDASSNLSAPIFFDIPPYLGCYGDADGDGASDTYYAIRSSVSQYSGLSYGYQLPFGGQSTWDYRPSIGVEADDTGTMYNVELYDLQNVFGSEDQATSNRLILSDLSPEQRVPIYQLIKEHEEAEHTLARVQPGEEVWIIQPPPQGYASQPDDGVPTTGELLTTVGEQRDVPLPLTHTDVHASIAGFIATVDVTQQFANPYDEKIEAVYVFPLPQDAGVNEFVMQIGERRIRGIVREREEAETIYVAARAQGYVASLLTQERPNIFTQRVANIEPGHALDIQLRYFNTLTYDDGWFEFRFPMVVGPRYNPPTTTDGVGAVASDESGTSDQPVEVPYLRPTERSGHDIALTVDVDAGTSLADLRCDSHAITMQRPSADYAIVTLDPADAIPNKDFVLRYQVATNTLKTGLITQHDARGGFFALLVYPPADLDQIQRPPLDVVFVIDTSGSMEGAPLELAKRAVTRGLLHLRDADTFQILNFSDGVSRFAEQSLPATDDNIRAALQHTLDLTTTGGTQMIHGIRAALADPPTDRPRHIVVLSDGYIGNEAEILGEVGAHLGDGRVFSIGIGAAPNDYLIQRLAQLGHGAVASVGLNDDVETVIDSFLERLYPALTDLAIDWGGADVHDVSPAHIPDLYAGRPLLLTGRYDTTAPHDVVVTGNQIGGERSFEVTHDPARDTDAHPGIAAVWARRQIMQLHNEMQQARIVDNVAAIRDLALTYGLLSDYTAFIAVDSLTQTDATAAVEVPVAVPVPAGVNYNTTVSDH